MAAARNAPHRSIIILIAALVACTYGMRFRRWDPSPSPVFERIPKEISGYVTDFESIGGAVVDMLGADATLFRAYRHDEEPMIWLFVAYFASPQENSQIHSPRHCYPGSGWNIIDEGTSRVMRNEETKPAKRLVISNGDERHFVLYWFITADGVLANEFALKWSQMKGSLLGRSRPTVFIRFSVELDRDADMSEAERALVRFAEELAPGIDEALMRAPGTDAG